MPYIKQKDRDRLTTTNTPTNPGELNYLITLRCISFMKEYGESYTNYNRVVGVLTRLQKDLILNSFFPNSMFKKYIFNLCSDYIKLSMLSTEDALDDIVGVLESAKAEFQRRAVNFYEDKKIIENGDVY